MTAKDLEARFRAELNELREGKLREHQRAIDWLRTRANRIQVRITDTLLDDYYKAPASVARRLHAEMEALYRAADDFEKDMEP